MVYVDTSVLVALFVNEPQSAAVAEWYAGCGEELVCAAWCVTEFASALGIKQRTGQMTGEQGATAWQAFERLCAGDLQLLPAEPSTFHRAAVLTLDASMGLRAGDALHLAAALDAKAKTMATLDGVLARNAERMKMALKSVEVLRAYWDGKLPVDPFRIAKAMGIVVRAEYKLEGDISGMIEYQGTTPVISCNLADPFVRQRFTVAHEIGHFALGHLEDGVCRFRDPASNFSTGTQARRGSGQSVCRRFADAR